MARPQVAHLAEHPAAANAGVSVADLRMRRDIHFLDPSSRDLSLIAGPTGSKTGAPESIAGEAPSGGLDSVLSGLLDHCVNVPDTSSSCSDSRSFAAQSAVATAAQARREPQLLKRLLQLCVLWLQSAAVVEQDGDTAARERPGLSAAASALEVLCAWASAPSAPAEVAEDQLTDTVAQAARAVAPAYLAGKGRADAEQALLGFADDRARGSASDEPDRMVVAESLLQLVGCLLPDAASDSKAGAIVAALASDLLAPLKSLPQLSSSAAQLQHDKAGHAAENVSDQEPGIRALLSKDGSMDWHTAQSAAEALDVRAAYAGLGILTAGSGSGQHSPSAAEQRRGLIKVTDDVTAETVAAVLLIAASSCATSPRTDAVMREYMNCEDAPPPLAAADGESGDDEEDLLGALFADDPDAGAVGDTAGKLCLTKMRTIACMRYLRTHDHSVIG